MKKSFLLLTAILSAFQLASCDSNNISGNSNNSEVLLQIGKKMMDISIDKTSNAISKAIVPADISLYRMQHAFPAVMVYWSGLLEKHPNFDCSDKIIKFDHKIQYPDSVPTTLGIQINLVVDKDNNQVILRATQGTNANDFYAAVGVKVNYNFETKTIGDYFFCMASLDETHKITSGQSYSKKGETFEIGNYLDEDKECANLVDDLMDPYIKMIPSATLIEGDEARTYMSDYCDAGDYYKTIGGTGIITCTVVD